MHLKQDMTTVVMFIIAPQVRRESKPWKGRLPGLIDRKMKGSGKQV